MTATTRWGILATGGIAHGFAHDLAVTPGAELVAVGSRRPEAARAFAAEHGVPRAHGSYAELVADPDIDVVYVATPHSRHLEDARLALEAGKHVLCEKPLALDAAESLAMIELARAHDRFLMEAMWTACHPVVHAVARDLRAGRFGTPRHLHAEIGFRVPPDPASRMWDPALGASVLLDMGIYPLTVAHLLLGEAESLSAQGVLSDRGTDQDVVVTGRYPGDVLATLVATMSSWSSRTATVATDLGRVDLHDFHHPTYAVFTPHDGEPVPIEPAEPVIGRGYGNEIAEVGRCLAAGLTESPLVPHAQTLLIMRQLDDLRRQVGVRT